MNKFFGDTNITSSPCKSTTLNTHRFTDNARSKQRRKKKSKEKDVNANITHTHHSTGSSDQRKSFAEIVRNSVDEDIEKLPIKSPNLPRIEAGEVGALGYDFRTIENSSVRSVLENLFKEPEKSTETESAMNSVAITFDLPNVNNEVCSSCVQKQNTVPQPISMPQMGTSILDNIFDEEKLSFMNTQKNTPFTNGPSNIVNFNYNLSELLYRVKQPSVEFPSAADYPSTFFVCPRCGEMTNLEVNDLERLGSIGDRCITSFSSRFQSNDIFSGQYSRRYTPLYNQSLSSSNNNVFAFKKSFGRMNRLNPFNGLNTRKKKSN